MTEKGRVMGVGGLFLRSPDPAGTRAWYARVLGLEISKWGGAKFPPLQHGSTTWSLFDASTTYFDPSRREAMINFVVDDLDALVARIEREGDKLLGREESDPNGRFAWLLDPDGTKLELWQPAS